MQSQQMAAMAAMNPNAIPVDGTPVMGNMPRPQRANEPDLREQLNTYIYDYFLRNNHVRLARTMLECDLKMATTPTTKPSPSGRNVNGVDAMDQDSKDDLPTPKLPQNQIADNSFLLDWWVQFWDIFHAARNRNSTTKGSQYIAHTRNLAQAQTDSRNQRMIMNNAGMGAQQYQNMMRVSNGMNPNDLKRAAAMNARNPNANPMANQMTKQAMLSAQMQRDGSSMDMNGQRGQSPNSNENGAPSPNKRPRVDGGMAGGMPGNQFNEFAQQAQNAQQKNIEVYAQSLAQQQRMALNNSAIAQGMNAGVQGSPMNQPGLDGQHEMFAGNQPRAPGMPAGAPGQPQGNHALQDYQMQLMLLEQQNKKRLLMARQEQDNMSGPHQQGGVGAPGFPPNMSPQGSRAGPSPNPTDQMKRGTPKLGQQGLPGSPMPEAAMQGQRNSPTPNMNFDPNTMPPGMPPQFYNQMPGTPMMRPPSSHPGAFNGQQLTPQQMEQMRQNGGMPNGAWRGPPQQGMMPGQPQIGAGPMAGNPQQRNQMPPPPAPAGEQPRTQAPSPSQSSQAPQTPSQTNKPKPQKGNKKDSKKPTKPKGPNTGATPAASGGEEPPTPTPSTPITPMVKNFQGPNGAQAPQPPAQTQAPAVAQQQAPMENSNGPFGSIDNDPTPFDTNFGFPDDNFDFDSFLQVGDDATGFGLGTDFSFGDGVEAGDGI